MKVIPVILCGGAGSRLWPLSRELYPKQLLSLVNDYSLLQNTVNRCAAHPDVESPVLVCNEAHRFLVAEQLREIDVSPSRIILEPKGRNTAPAVALAAQQVMKDEDAVLVVLPSDHVIQKPQVFLQALSLAIECARDDHLVTFGVVADRPETGCRRPCPRACHHGAGAGRLHGPVFGLRPSGTGVGQNGHYRCHAPAWYVACGPLGAICAGWLAQFRTDAGLKHAPPCPI